MLNTLFKTTIRRSAQVIDSTFDSPPDMIPSEQTASQLLHQKRKLQVSFAKVQISSRMGRGRFRLPNISSNKISRITNMLDRRQNVPKSNCFILPAPAKAHRETFILCKTSNKRQPSTTVNNDSLVLDRQEEKEKHTEKILNPRPIRRPGF